MTKEVFLEALECRTRGWFARTAEVDMLSAGEGSRDRRQSHRRPLQEARARGLRRRDVSLSHARHANTYPANVYEGIDPVGVATDNLDTMFPEGTVPSLVNPIRKAGEGIIGILGDQSGTTPAGPKVVVSVSADNHGSLETANAPP